ncbi:adenylate/guanylate cyclase domain-containing protein [Permianibacter aggregans]|uniref:Adenylate cyclase n=1 Tax=Permianibacter aggregans TaxID=1510150 RepID=A0A4R6UMS1_9GAMM|nr:adenylate/guanylate cyclase domain-containing protein [Permianibacter aggregans]QGX40601.1 HAMP domain-containing protein [Permianibacter aggregans]TDQ46465.1 adenylate cyclase [Permianibacter aggregans]
MATSRYRSAPYNLKTEAPSLTLAQKLAFAIGGVMAVIMAISWWFTSFSVERLLAQHAIAYGHHLAKLSASSAAEPLLAEDKLQLSVLLGTIKDDPYILSAAVYDQYGLVVVSTDEMPALPIHQLDKLSLVREMPSLSTQVALTAPILFHDLKAGYLLITLDRESLENPLRNSVRKIAIASALMIVVAMFGAYLLGRWLAQPIDRLTHATRALREGRYELLINERRDDEIGEIIGTLNDMAQHLHKRQHTEKTLSRFVSKSVATQLMLNDGVQAPAKHVVATVVFIDLVGFTSLSEKLPAQRVAELLNFYFSLVNRAAKLYQGNVDKYIGDGVMLVFGSPHKDPEHPFHALCFCSLFSQLVEASVRHRPSWMPPVQFRIGLHTGDMIAGSMGSEDRMQYTVIGDSVNTAARLCEASTGSEIVLSEAVLHQPKIRHRIEVEAKGNIALKGKSEQTSTFVLKRLHEPFNLLIDRQVEHVLSYLPKLSQ